MSKYQIGNKNGAWRGGRTITQHGYALIRVGKDHPLADIRGYAYEHRVVASKKVGRWLKKGEIVHHIDGNPLNNNPDNLEVVTNIFEHRFRHRVKSNNKRKPGEHNPVILCFCGCGQFLNKFDTSNRPRQYINGHNLRGRLLDGREWDEFPESRDEDAE